MTIIHEWLGATWTEEDLKAPGFEMTIRHTEQSNEEQAVAILREVEQELSQSGSSDAFRVLPLICDAIDLLTIWRK